MTNHAVTAEALTAEIRAEMGRQRKSQADLARALGVHPATAASRVNGSTPFDVVELAAIATWLDLTVSEFFARAEAASSSRRATA